MILVLLGVVDVIAGLVLLLYGMPFYQYNSAILFLGIIMMIKGLWSYLTAAAGGFFFDLMGIMDIVSAVFIIILFAGFGMFFFAYMGILMLIKGLYSCIVGVVNR